MSALNTEHWPAASHELAQLLSRSALGDRRAFADLYRRTSAHLFAVVLRIQRDRAVAEDVLQDVFVGLWRMAGSYDGRQGQPMTWLTSIARHRAIDSLRRQQAQPATQPLERDDDDDSGSAGPQWPSEAPGPVELLDRAGQARQLGECMAGLTAEQRQCMALAFYDGLSQSEISAHLRAPLGSVKSWIRRALGTLRRCLDRAVQHDEAADLSRGRA